MQNIKRILPYKNNKTVRLIATVRILGCSQFLCGFFIGDNVMSKFDWKPTRKTYFRLFDMLDESNKFKFFRQSSSAYVKRKEVREYVLKKHNYKCAFCGSSEKLHIDHILSVKKCFDAKDYFMCNTIENLQVLCQTCNILKS